MIVLDQLIDDPAGARAVSRSGAIAAADVGGPEEILNDGLTGRLFPPRDADALARVLIELATHPSFRRQLGEAALRDVCEMWGWPEVVRRMTDVYDELCTGITRHKAA
ncbi:MAG TPA: glycosyltransferase [Mycobacteriales bacterium]